jgi:hypothetical protein
MRPMVVALAVLGWIACSSRKESASPSPPAAAVDQKPATEKMIRESDLASAQRDTERDCKGRVSIYEGGVAVDARNYVQTVERGSDWVEEAVPRLDKVISKEPRIEFTLDYPFEKPFTGVVTGEITLRRIIDAVRAGFRHMYEGTSQRDIPNMYNKDVTGPYGRSFHVIGDLVIERIDLCDGGKLDISIGS